MARRVKPANRKDEPKRPLARKAPKNDGARVRDLEQRLAEALAQQTATAEILSVISRAPTELQSVLDAVAQNASRLCGAANVSLYRVEGHLMRKVAEYGAPLTSLQVGETRPINRMSVSGRAILDRTTVHVPDHQGPEAVQEYPEARRDTCIRTTIGIPLLREDRAIGAFTAYRTESRPFSDSQIALLKTFADQAVIAIENVRLFTELQSSNRDLTTALEQQTATSDILKVISSSPTDVQPVFDAIVRAAVGLCHAVQSNVQLFDGQLMHFVAQHNIGPAAMEMVQRLYPMPPNRSQTASRTVLDRAVVHVPNVLDDPDYLRELALEGGWRSVLSVPMIGKGQPIGAITVTRLEPGWFSEKEIALLQTFADQAVIAIENVRLFTELQQKNEALMQAHAQVSEALEQQTATSEILRVISSSPTDVQPVFGSLVTSAARLSGANDLLLLIREGDVLRPVAGVGGFWESLASDFRVPLVRGSVAARSVIDGTVLHFPDLATLSSAEFPTGRELQVRFGHRTVLAVPLVREGVALGTIFALRFEIQPFAEQQIALLKTFADQAVIAIENVRLFQELEKKNAALTAAHAQVTEALEQQTATSEILRVISRSPTDVQPVFDAIAVSATTLCDADLSGLFRFDGDLIHFVAQHGRTREEIDAAQRAFPQPPSHQSITARAILAAAVVQIADVGEDPELDDSLRMFRTVLSVPLMREGRPLGAITLARRTVRPFTDKQIELVRTFADQAAIAIENVRLFNETKEALERQTATGEILQVISSSPTDVQPVFDAIAQSARRLCEAQFCHLFRFDGKLLHFVAHHGLTPEGVEAVRRGYPMAPSRSSAAARSILSGAVEHIPDVHADPEYGHGAIAKVVTSRSNLAVPMLRDRVPIGAIVVARPQAGLFTVTQIELLKTFADQAVIAIENVRLFTELQERNRALTEALDQQTATAEILRVISSSPTDVQPVFNAIADSALRLLRGWGALVVRFDGRLLHAAAIRGGAPGSEDALRERFPVPARRGEFAGEVILDRAVKQIADVETDGVPAGLRANARVRGWRANLGVPMLHDGQPIGLITVTRAEPGAYSPQEVELLQTFADQAVIAIENVRLFTELQARNRDLTEALEQQTATSEILRVISSSPTDTQPVFDAIAANAARLCRANDAQVLRVEGEVLRLVAAFGAPSMPSVRPLTRGHLVGRAVIDRKTIHVRDLAQALAEYPETTAARYGVQSALAVPLLREGVTLGVIRISRSEIRPFTDNQIALLKTFADQAVIAIENVRLFKELQSSNRDLTEALEQQTATGEVLRTIAQTKTDPQPVFDTIVRSAAKLCHAANAAVFLTDGRMVYEPANFGGSPEALAATRARFPRPVSMDSTAGIAILTRSVFHVPDTEDPSVIEHLRQSGRLVGFQSAVTVPMLREGEAVGAILVARRAPGSFSDAEVGLLKTFADQAVIAVENVRLFKELEARTAALTRSVEQLTALGEVGRAVSSTLDLETVLTTIVSRAVQLSGLDGGVVLEYDEGAEEFVQRAQAETGGALAAPRRETRIRKGEGVVGQTAITLEPVQVPDITLPGAYVGPNRENLIESGIRAIVAVPMVREGQLIGCLGVTRNHPGEFSVETVKLLRTFATQSALAIQNARLFREIEEKSRQLEVASQHKSEFLANMSHELRTPLNAIIGFSEVLSERMFGEVNEKQEEYLKDIHASGQHLLSLINDILDLSKIEAGRMGLELTEFDLPTAIDNALMLVRERAGRRGIALHMDVDDRLGQVRADERKVRQVVLNLLSNAIKFTPEGGRIEVRAVPRDGFVAVSVSDTGIGIAPEDQETVFEEFRQVGTADKKVEGTGLGLTLCRKFVELHGGRIWVKSEIGVGSTFTFTIPKHREAMTEEIPLH